MKIKTYFAFLALMLSFGVAHAQKGYHFGLGYTYSATTVFDRELWGDVRYNYRYTSGHAPGIAVGWNFTEMLGIQAEVNYAWTGIKTRQDFPNTGFDRDLRLQYVQIPVLFKATAGDFNNRFAASVGPYVGFKTAAKLETSQIVITTMQPDENGTPVPVTTVIPAMTTNIKEQIHNVDVGININAGGEFNVGEDLYMSVGMRATYGFTNINKEDRILSNITPNPERLGNATLGINVGIHKMIRDE